MPIHHFTCNHGQTGIVNDGFRVRTPATRMLPTVYNQAEASLGAMAWTLNVTWYTDEELPDKDWLGFGVGDNPCDRTEHRFRVRDETQVRTWRAFTRDAPRALVEAVASIPGANPETWLVSIERAVPVSYEAITEDERQRMAAHEYAKGRLWKPGD